MDTSKELITMKIVPFTSQRNNGRCPFCGEEITDEKTTCVNCGVRFSKINCISILRNDRDNPRPVSNSPMLTNINKLLSDEKFVFAPALGKIYSEIREIGNNPEDLRDILLFHVNLFFMEKEEAISGMQDAYYQIEEIASGTQINEKNYSDIQRQWAEQHHDYTPVVSHLRSGYVRDQKYNSLFLMYQCERKPNSVLRESEQDTKETTESENESQVSDTRQDENAGSPLLEPLPGYEALQYLAWHPDGYLKTFADRTLENAQKLASKGFIRKIQSAMIDGDPVIWITVAVPEGGGTLCDIDVEHACPSNKIRRYITSPTKPLSGNYCPAVHYCLQDGCLILIAAYLCYLQKNNLLKEAYDERKAYFSTLPNVHSYHYIWPGKNYLNRVPDQVFEYAEKLEQNNFVSVGAVLDEKERICIHLAGDCLLDPSKATYHYFDQILRKKPENCWPLFVSPNFSGYARGRLIGCNGCGMEACPFLIAAWIRYLKATEQAERIGIEREEYKRKRAKFLASYSDELKDINRRTQGAESIENAIATENSHFLYGIIEGGRNAGKQEIYKRIGELLYKCGKTESKEIVQLRFDQLMSQLVYKNSKTEEIVFDRLKKNRLYVIYRMDELLKFAKDSSHGSLSVSRLMDVLGFLEENTYVLLETQNEKETEAFLNLRPVYRFLYGKYIMRILPQSAEEMYEDFVNKLSPGIRKQITNEMEYKEKFVEWIETNRSLVPLENSDITLYLANQINESGDPELPVDPYSQKDIQEELDSLIGLEEVKKTIEEFQRYVRGRQDLASSIGDNDRSHFPELHMLFLGNPGTGKTRVANLMADLLYNVGILSKRKLTAVERKDLIGSHIGETSKKTTEIINEALGGVLFIDEAYSLAYDSYGKEAIATLLTAMESYKDRLIVIFAGYEEEMQDFLQANSGLSSRIGYTFRFRDYSPDELVRMYFKAMRNSYHYNIEEDAIDAVREVCEYFSKRKNFGNGRFVERLLQETQMKHFQRIDEKDYERQTILKCDIPQISDLLPKVDREQEDLPDLSDVIGMKEVKEKIRSMTGVMEFEQSRGLHVGTNNRHMMFLGNPGTGKTMMARQLARELYHIGAIRENKMIETDRSGLVAGYVGQTALKTKKVIDRAIGGILFIDEAYSLTPEGGNSSYDFGAEAIATLVKAMDDYREDLIVIFAGYPNEMKNFLQINAGIRSRIGNTFTFPDYTARELVEIADKKLQTRGYEDITDDVSDALQRLMQYFVSVPNFGNGRFAESVAELIHEKHSLRCKDVDDEEEYLTITTADVPTTEEVTAKLPGGDSMIRPSELTEEQNKRTAYHELGHAIVQMTFFPQQKIERITIAAEGNGALGYVQLNPESRNMTASDFRKCISVGMAGMAAEEVFFGEYENGAVSDLEKATQIAQSMIMHWGMSRHGFAYQKNISDDVLQEENEILSQQFETAKKIIESRKAEIDQAAGILLLNREISQEKLNEIINSSESTI